MMLRTPPPRKRRLEEASIDAPASSSGVIVAAAATPDSDRRLVIYEDPPEEEHLPASECEQMMCTYQCRQMVKAEFFDALDTAEKQVCEYQSKTEALSSDLSKSESERKRYHDRLRYVEQELAAAKGREKALQDQLLKEVGESQERHQKQAKHCSELEVKLKKEMEMRKIAESSAFTSQEKAQNLEEKLQSLSESTEREKNRLQKELAHLQNESELSVSRLYIDLERVRCTADNAEKESDLLMKQLEDLRRQLNECLQRKSEAERGLSSSDAVIFHDTSSSDDHVLVKHLQEELRNYEAEVQEARKLKNFHVNNELLKEKLLDEKGRRERAEAELSTLQDIQINAKKMEDELISWKSLINEIPGVSSYGDIPKKFASLQKEVIENMMKVGELSARLKELEVGLEASELAKQHAETESALAKKNAEELNVEVNRLEMMLSSVTEERDRLCKDALTSNKHKTGEAQIETTKETLIKVISFPVVDLFLNVIHHAKLFIILEPQELESSLARKEFLIRELESSLHEQKEVINHQRGELNIFHEKINIEAKRVKSLEREADRLRSEISLLESKVGHGDYSTSNTKVLRMVNTLAVEGEAKHTIEALQAELQKTQAKLQAVEDLKGQSDAGDLIDSSISEKLAQLKGQIATLEKREERYKAVFAEKISVFRRACCSLFGYKIVMDDHQRPNGIPVTHFTLQSIYAQTDDEKLEYEYESGNMNIIINEYASQREILQQIEIFIRKMNSIPAFMANLTMESFNKRTLS
ncbi:hypothetical protein QJS04_geneDACA009091 [Acorus gramineus]|uniref:Mitotic spindle checkpoint protein MAD1 n=1 Tax=Acorus gramineus TaxID=55184 RepID=A0AAV9AQ68_ACOGR|nr:hypothetical protein QJS04_geneDACA009091 [Acorus gramineus]